MDRIKLTAWLFTMLIAMSACSNKLKIDSVTPDQVVSGEPTLVQIKGQGFVEGTRVWIGAEECSQVAVAGKNSLVVLPARDVTPGTRTIRVKTPQGASASLEKAIEVKSGLRLDSISPTFMPLDAKGVVLSLKGTGFRSGSRVKFGEVESPRVELKDDTFLTAKAPELPVGVHDVTIIDDQGNQTSLYQSFQVMAPETKTGFQPFEEQGIQLGIGEKGRNKNGAAVADVNGDGYDDLFIAASVGSGLFLGNADGTFRDGTAELGLDSAMANYSGIFGDFDNDGWPDLATTGRSIVLYRNLEGKRFEEVTTRVGLIKDNQVFSAAWADVDNDGLLDLYVGYSKQDDRFYHNVGGRFEQFFADVIAKMPLAKKLNNAQPTTFAETFGDYDLDGDLDLFVGVRGQSSFFFQNENGKSLKNVIDEVGLKSQIPGTNPPLYFIDWGLSFADYNNDGYLDLFSTSGPAHYWFYRNQKGKSFENVTAQVRTNVVPSPLGCSFGDFDNDGLLDLAVSDNVSGLSILRNNGDGSFTNLTSELGMAELPRNPMGILWMDVNRDGALDLVVTQFLQRDLIYMNHPYPGRHYLEIKLKGTVHNSSAIGAMVNLQVGSTLLTRQVSGGDGYLTQLPATQHFGIGTATRVDKITVRWPGGVTQVIDGATSDQILTITEPGERKPVELPPPLAGSTAATPPPAPGAAKP